MIATLTRRAFITLLGGAAAWPLAARAQQEAMPVVGFLGAGSPNTSAHFVAAFHGGLKEVGYVADQNVAIEYRWARGRYDQLPGLAADLAHLQVMVIATGPGIAALAAKAATTTIPIVFTSGPDPVEIGLVPNLNRPGSNLTGVSLFSATLLAKRLELLHELIPNAFVIAILANPKATTIEPQVRALAEAAGARGERVHRLYASTEKEVDVAFATLAQLQISALFVVGDPFFTTRVNQLTELASHYAIPTVYDSRDFTAAGGLMSYGASLTDSYHWVGLYTGRILKGEKAADLPVLQPTKFELVINLKTAKTLGLLVPDRLLALADEVIE